MTISVNVPAHLFSEIQIRAVQEGREVQEVVAELLQAGISSSPPAFAGQRGLVSKNLPLIKGRPAEPSAAPQLTAQQWSDWVKHLEMRHELERYEKTLGHQHVDCAHY